MYSFARLSSVNEIPSPCSGLHNHKASLPPKTLSKLFAERNPTTARAQANPWECTTRKVKQNANECPCSGAELDSWSIVGIGSRTINERSLPSRKVQPTKTTSPIFYSPYSGYAVLGNVHVGINHWRASPPATCHPENLTHSFFKTPATRLAIVMCG